MNKTDKIYNKDYYPIEFNFYPMPQKNNLMDLNGLNSRDFPLKKINQINTKRNYSLNNYAIDIQGACPRPNSLFTKKIDYSNTNHDIEKSSASRNIPVKVNRPIFNLTNKDIEGSSPCGLNYLSTNRHVNPLWPEYNLPTYNDEFKNEKPRFLRNSIEVSDIKGASAKDKRKYKPDYDYMDIYKFERDNDIYHDHKSLYKGNKNKLYNSLDFRDVYNKKQFSNRHTNPLDPVYFYDSNMTEIDNENSKYLNKNFEYGLIEGNKPRIKNFEIKKNLNSKNLETKDIEGAQTNTKTVIEKLENKFNRKLNYSVDEIYGSKAGSLKKGIMTGRHTNPLEPTYDSLGELKVSIGERADDFDNNRYDYKSLLKFYNEHSKIRPYERKEKNSVNKDYSKEVENINYKNLNENNRLIKNKPFFNFGADKKKYNIIGLDDNNTINNKYINTDINNTNNSEVNENKNPSKIYYPLYHDKNVVPTEPNFNAKAYIERNKQLLHENPVDRASLNLISNPKTTKENKLGKVAYESEIDKFLTLFPTLK